MKTWRFPWKKASASRITSDKRQRTREGKLRLESLESRQLLSIVTVVAKDPSRGEDPVGGQPDTGQFVVTRDTVSASPLTVRLQFGGAQYGTMFTTTPSISSWPFLNVVPFPKILAASMA